MKTSDRKFIFFLVIGICSFSGLMLNPKDWIFAIATIINFVVALIYTYKDEP